MCQSKKFERTQAQFTNCISHSLALFLSRYLLLALKQALPFQGGTKNLKVTAYTYKSNRSCDVHSIALSLSLSLSHSLFLGLFG